MKLEIDVDVKDICSTMHDYYGLILTQKFVKEVLGEQSHMAGDIVACGFDTCAREGFADYIVQKVMKDCPGPVNESTFSKEKWNWPLGGDSKEYSKEFEQNFREQVAKTQGIRLIKDWGIN